MASASKKPVLLIPKKCVGERIPALASFILKHPAMRDTARLTTDCLSAAMPGKCLPFTRVPLA